MRCTHCTGNAAPVRVEWAGTSHTKFAISTTSRMISRMPMIREIRPLFMAGALSVGNSTQAAFLVYRRH